MSGGYISCGQFMGEDKSGNAFFGLLEDHEEVVSEEERQRWEEAFAEPLRWQMDAQDEDEAPLFRIDKTMMETVVTPLTRYYERQTERLGNPDPMDAPNLDDGRDGEGWKYYCAYGLLRAWQECQKTGKDVVVHFD
jgi:hypothetical protein